VGGETLQGKLVLAAGIQCVYLHRNFSLAQKIVRSSITSGMRVSAFLVLVRSTDIAAPVSMSDSACYLQSP